MNGEKFMTTEQALIARSAGKCELCTAETALSVYEVPPTSGDDASRCVMICDNCNGQITGALPVEPNHWRALNDTMWSQQPAVQVMAWRMLSRLSSESWAQDLLDILYLDDDLRQWAEEGAEEGSGDEVSCRDSNGTALLNGDSVTLIKDLVVKGANFTAKRGTMVKGISLTDNPEQVEGRVNGTRIVLLSCFLKKVN